MLEGQSDGSKPRGDRLRDQAGRERPQRIRLCSETGQRPHRALRNALQVQSRRILSLFVSIFIIKSKFDVLEMFIP